MKCSKDMTFAELADFRKERLTVPDFTYPKAHEEKNKQITQLSYFLCQDIYFQALQTYQNNTDIQ